ncbi:MAG: hypothetical protein RR580_03480, partial [Christensenellaceae bacterium]
ANGWVLFENVPEGEHAIFVKNDNGTIIGSTDFDLLQGQKTDLIVGDKVQVVVNATVVDIAVDVEVDEAKSICNIMGVRENATPKGLIAAKPVVSKPQDQTAKPFISQNSFWLLLLCIVATAVLIIVILIIFRRKANADEADEIIETNENSTDIERKE